MIAVDRLVSVTLAGSPLSRVEPVTLAEARKQLNDPPESDNGLIEGYIAAARALFEAEAGHQTIDAIWELTTPRPVSGVLELPRPPMTMLLEVRSRDAFGAENTLDPALYRSDLSGVLVGSPGELTIGVYPPPGRIELLTGSTWPTGQIIVRRRCGYGPTPEQVPHLVKVALYFLIGHFYRNRAEVTSESVMQLPMGAAPLIRGFKYAALPVHC